MFLKSLSMSSEGKVIRQIVFHKGLNLIVDETPASTSRKETGNNVGKTTVLMLVDFCLGASGKQIYTDPENKKEEYRRIKDFLMENKVLVKLILKEDLDQETSREFCIERNFLNRKSKVQRINGVDLQNEEFDQELTDILFPGHYNNKPTFRQIIAHNIRYKDLSINKTIKHLDGFTRDDEYETLYLFLLGCKFEQGDAKQELRTRIKLEETFKARLEKEQTKSAYETALALLEGEIETLELRKSNFKLNEHFSDDLNSLDEVKYQVNLLSSEIGKLNIRRSLILEAQDDLRASISTIDLQQLKQIYHQAKAQVSGIQKTFDELHQFHNRMVNEKVTYITKELPVLESTIKAKNEQLGRLLDRETTLSTRLTQSESFEQLEKLLGELNEKFRKKGEYETIINQLREIEANLHELNKKLSTIDDALFSEDSEQRVKEQVKKFNRQFASISQELYGEQWALKVDQKVDRNGKRLYEFSSFNTNFSSGKKQGEISCFEIAYILFADQENIPCMHFVLNDKKELMHDNQLLKIETLVKTKNIQFIASILRDKLPSELDSNEYIIIRLSQGDKLFRIESPWPPQPA